MVSDFRKKKLLHVFNVFFDTDKSGSVTKQDFEQAAQKAAKLKGWAADTPEAKKLEEANLKIWNLLKSQADSDDDGEISADEWITMWEGLIKKLSSGPGWQSENCKLSFKFIDSANDGVIDAEEFATAYSVYGLSKEEAVQAFKKASSGRDTLNFEEFQELWKQFFVSENPEDPGNYIFGNLQ